MHWNRNLVEFFSICRRQKIGERKWILSIWLKLAIKMVFIWLFRCTKHETGVSFFVRPFFPMKNALKFEKSHVKKTNFENYCKMIAERVRTEIGFPIWSFLHFKLVVFKSESKVIDKKIYEMKINCRFSEINFFFNFESF